MQGEALWRGVEQHQRRPRAQAGRRAAVRAQARESIAEMENYHVIELVGEGSFGKVYKARRKRSAQIVAIKFIVKHGKTDKDIHNLRYLPITKLPAPSAPLRRCRPVLAPAPCRSTHGCPHDGWCRQEIEILRSLEHPNIIQMLDSFETPSEFCVVTEFAQVRTWLSTRLAACWALRDALVSADAWLATLTGAGEPDAVHRVSCSRFWRTTRACPSPPFSTSPSNWYAPPTYLAVTSFVAHSMRRVTLDKSANAPFGYPQVCCKGEVCRR